MDARQESLQILFVKFKQSGEWKPMHKHEHRIIIAPITIISRSFQVTYWQSSCSKSKTSVTQSEGKLIASLIALNPTSWRGK